MKDYNAKAKVAKRSYDFCNLAEEILDSKSGAYDFAHEMYQKAIEKADDCLNYHSCADSIADKKYLGDKEWAREVYTLAIEHAEISDEYRYCADSIADKKYLGDCMSSEHCGMKCAIFTTAASIL